VLTPAQAASLIGQHLKTLPVDSLPLSQCAGAVLREDIYAERDQPPFDRVTMDGIAVNSGAMLRGASRLRIQAVQAAGQSPLALDAQDACIEVMTGAVLPTGCDAVIPVEQIQTAGGFASLGSDTTVAPSQNIHRRGSDTREGALLLRAGVRLSAPEVAIAASAGLARVRVSSQPAIVVISTGDELIEPGEPILPHQIRRSNAYGVAAALRHEGFQRVADDHIVDDAAQLKERLRLHLDTHDVLILSGGVSMGRFDLVPQALEQLGVRQIFHRIAQRPGKPFWFGVADSGTAVFALPGNPVSTLVCLVRYVIPALFSAMGQMAWPTGKAKLGADFTSDSTLTVFLPVRIESDHSACALATPCPTNGSGDFTALAGTDGFIELPPGPNTFPEGFVTPLYRW
jgi:molybdopterin molybdotransferase